ncbi:hypothetical protein H0H92_010156, partial [Tricholoma furcatifolium]
SAFSESLCVDDDPARIRVLTGHATAPRASSRVESRQSPTLLLTVRGLLLAWNCVRALGLRYGAGE